MHAAARLRHPHILGLASRIRFPPTLIGARCAVPAALPAALFALRVDGRTLINHDGATANVQTTRPMAHTILSIVTSQQMPDSGIGHQRLTLLFDVLLAVLTIALLLSLARVRRRHRRMVQRGITSRSELWLRVTIAVVVNFALPVVLLYLT